MAMMGMLPVIASMVGSDSAIVGFGVHMMISVLIGLGLTVPFGNRLLTSYGRGGGVNCCTAKASSSRPCSSSNPEG